MRKDIMFALAAVMAIGVCVALFVVGIIGFLKEQDKILNINPPPQNETYTVAVINRGQPVLNLTNVIKITNCTPHCRAMVYVHDGTTNVFHGFLVDLDVKTNQVLERK